MSAYDPEHRRRTVRKGKQKGCWVFIPAAELRVAGIDPEAEPPWYRTWGQARGGVLVRLYKRAGSP